MDPGIRAFQQRMRELYGAKDGTRGSAGTFMYLIEEVGELAEACREPQRHDLNGEFADVFAWLASLANLHGVDLAAAVEAKYPAQCPACASAPCRCVTKP
ncbi:MAG: MazG nucleotide pyrophosphohydrolase domain-containing protein [Planctomycetota bacterium]